MPTRGRECVYDSLHRGCLRPARVLQLSEDHKNHSRLSHSTQSFNPVVDVVRCTAGPCVTRTDITAHSVHRARATFWGYENHTKPRLSSAYRRCWTCRTTSSTTSIECKSSPTFRCMRVYVFGAYVASDVVLPALRLFLVSYDRKGIK